MGVARNFHMCKPSFFHDGRQLRVTELTSGYGVTLGKHSTGAHDLDDIGSMLMGKPHSRTAILGTRYDATFPGGFILEDADAVRLDADGPETAEMVTLETELEVAEVGLHALSIDARPLRLRTGDLG